MNGINLRLASLKGASLRSCNLRYAIMAGTDLEVSMREGFGGGGVCYCDIHNGNDGRELLRSQPWIQLNKCVYIYIYI